MVLCAISPWPKRRIMVAEISRDAINVIIPKMIAKRGWHHHRGVGASSKHAHRGA